MKTLVQAEQMIYLDKMTFTLEMCHSAAIQTHRQDYSAGLRSLT